MHLKFKLIFIFYPQEILNNLTIQPDTYFVYNVYLYRYMLYMLIYQPSGPKQTRRSEKHSALLLYIGSASLRPIIGISFKMYAHGALLLARRLRFDRSRRVVRLLFVLVLFWHASPLPPINPINLRIFIFHVSSISAFQSPVRKRHLICRFVYDPTRAIQHNGTHQPTSKT